MFVFSTDMGRRLFENAVRLMTAVHIRLAGAAPQAERMQQKLQDIRIIDKAKCLLIQYSGLTEEEAHRYVESRRWTGGCPAAASRRKFSSSTAADPPPKSCRVRACLSYSYPRKE